MAFLTAFEDADGDLDAVLPDKLSQRGVEKLQHLLKDPKHGGQSENDLHPLSLLP
jgi:hypothetical protein